VESLELSIVRLVASKQGLALKIKYIFLCAAYYPFMLIKDKSNKSKADTETSNAGDDVYPLF